MSYIEKGYSHIWLPYTQMKIAPKQLEVVSADGVRIKLKDGRELIDGISSWWSVAHGYNHPAIIEAITNQAKTLPHIMMAGLANEQTYKLAYNISQITPHGLNHVFFSDSGSTAVEVAMKIAVQFFINQSKDQFKSKKTKFICFQNSYHGDTAGAMSLGDIKKGMHRRFSNYLMKNYSTKLPTNEKELKQFDDFVRRNQSEAAAVIIEPLVQCAGGMKFHSPEILKSIYDITKKYGLFFIADECATGFYRTGEYFACNHSGITPDIMVIGKALTGGVMTLAATIVTDEIYNQFLNDELQFALMHGPTFMGNPLACSAANASIELFAKNDYKQKVEEVSKILKRELEKCRSLLDVVDVRILGAIGVVQVENLQWKDIFQMRKDFIKEGVFLRPFSDVIYVMPPLIIQEADLVKITDAIFKMLN
ncbi:MAG: adenosylmethionine--8-amino-7-oxononanoate transaminase [Rickettsiaceae bacterium]|jgi:adenosylmethionine-8-amino-7-oxononanoate aminotransferase|nr:adenosylmethionine--8-amino-7-oxononanoate transaminase [Rickettsiaceae bacterium]